MYEAIVCKLENVRAHPNAHSLQLATACNTNLVVGMDVIEGTLGILFPSDGILSDEFCLYNDLYPRVDDEGNRAGGYFTSGKARVRSQAFRGEKSDGFWMPLSCLTYLGDPSVLNDGDKLSEFNGVSFCEKYFTPQTLNAMKNGTPKTKRVNVRFPMHVDTEQLAYNVYKIPSDAVCYISAKLHGSSQRVGHVPEPSTMPNGLLRRLFRRPERAVEEWTDLLGTRRVTLDGPDTTKGYYQKSGEKFRYDAAQSLFGQLHKGEVVYGEVVGYTTDGTPIMATHDASKFKEIKRQYGKEIIYKYGQPVGTCKFYVYRITRVNEDGVEVDLSWPAVKKRATELGVDHVPELCGPFVRSEMSDEDLLTLVEEFLEGPDWIDHSHPREGVVVRAEHVDVQFYKSKSWTFRALEGILKDNDQLVDREEAS